MGIVKAPSSTGAPISISHFTFDIESGAEELECLRGIAVQDNTDRDPLLHLDEIARGIVLRNQ